MSAAAGVYLSYELFFGKMLVFPKPNESSAAAWVQAAIYSCTLLVTCVLAFQVFLILRQMRNEQHKRHSEAYRILLRPEMQSTKRVLWSEDVGTLLSAIDNKLDSLKGGTPNIYRAMLEDVRKRFDEIAGKIPMALFFGKTIGFDHVEALINEYNYLSKMIEEGQIEEGFATELSRENFKTVYKRVLPVIKLRQRISAKYASHFDRYVRRK